MAQRTPAKPNREMVQAARRLRKEATYAETLLWQALRGNQIDGLKFRRQHAIGPYILDFYCVAYALAIEIDGSVHEEEDQKQHDRERTEYLDSLGISVLRFKNEQIEQELAAVLRAVRSWTNQRQ